MVLLLLSTDEWRGMREIFYVFTTIYCFLYTLVLLAHCNQKKMEKEQNKWMIIIDLCEWVFGPKQSKTKLDEHMHITDKLFPVYFVSFPFNNWMNRQF